MMPQGSSFQASKGDVLDAISFFFGAPVSPEKLRGTNECVFASPCHAQHYSEHHAATYHFPGAQRSPMRRTTDTHHALQHCEWCSQPFFLTRADAYQGQNM
eukprot:2522156-Prymnesium_polylepis.1